MGTMRKLRRAGLRDRVEPLRQRQPIFPRKMSEVLLDFAEPFLDTLTDEQFEAGISFAAICWNISFLPLKKQQQQINDIIDEFGKSDPLARRDVEDCVNMLLKRRKTLFAHDRRMIVDYKVVEEKYSQRLLVMSRLMKD